VLSLLKEPGAKAFYAVIFLNACVDLGHKITLQNTVFKIYDGTPQIILAAFINALIILPYIFLVLPIGRVARRYPKPEIIRAAALTSLFLTLLIALCYQRGWFYLALAMTLLMAIQSAFYAPAKLAYLRLLFGVDQLSRSNGLAQAVVIAGILFGTLFFSLGFEWRYVLLPSTALVLDAQLLQGQVLQLMVPLALVLVLLAALQLYCAVRIPRREEDLSQAAEQPMPENSVSLLFSQRALLLPVLGLALFWSIGQGMLAVFPAFAKQYAAIGNAALIQAVLATTALGTAAGAYLAACWSPQGARLSLAAMGFFSLAVGLWLLPLLRHPLAFVGDYFFLGIASGMIIVPLNACLQMRAAPALLGGVLAGSQCLQNIAMLAMLLVTISAALLQLDSRNLLQCMALLTSFLGGLLSLLLLRSSRVAHR